MTNDKKLQLITDNIISKIDARILKIKNSIDPNSTEDEGFEPDIEKETELSTLRIVSELIQSEIESVNNLYLYDEDGEYVNPMTLAEQFAKEVEENASKGNVGLDLFHDTVLKYKGKRAEVDFEFEDESRAYWDSYNSQWVLSEE